ncbi:alpha/beta hydrolase [Nonomuraea rosea]|uniref:Alpha/beta hydrolase n=1 Tax=Nonomuraea rosea TaxID=638574 RepID=A0ABP6ZVJ8_9ACTN
MMSLIRTVVASTALAALLPASAVARTPAAEISWHACPALPDDVLKARGVVADRMPQLRTLLARMECGKVNVPLDYRAPHGRRITIALTRLKATGSANRLGSLALNPGGPGGSGYLMPVEVVMMSEQNARLNDRYDLIGFDPRGVGHSTKAACPPAAGGPPAPGPLTRQAAKAVYASEKAANAACGRSDPDFLGTLTTLNAARDLDRIRAALGEDKLSFLGVSWGTWLGAVYRGTYPNRVHRMFLDSVALPRFRLDDFEDGRADATERGFSRLAAWIARRHDTYGFGGTAKQVTAAVVKLGRAYDDRPRRYTDVPAVADGALVAMLAGRGSPDWPKVAKALSELRDATGTTVPPAVKEMLGGPPPAMPPGAPEQMNATASQAFFCDEDASRLGFDAAWTAYQRRLERNPVTGRAQRFSAGCAGWPLPVQKIEVNRVAGSLVLSGHRHESISPYAWTTDMRRTIGGTLFTVEDDMHGSAIREPDCAAELVSYFLTGRIGRGCQGVATP